MYLQQIDCHNAIISPGYIDLQINGEWQWSSFFLFVNVRLT